MQRAPGAEYSAEMSQAAYEALAQALDRLPNGYPRTESGVEILILRKIFSHQEAALAALLGTELEGEGSVAARAGLPVAAAHGALMEMARRGLVWPGKGNDGPAFRLAPFVVGIYEAQLETLDHELAHLMEDYFEQGGAKGIMGPLPSLHRVVPTQGGGEVGVDPALRRREGDAPAVPGLLGAGLYLPQGAGCPRQEDLLHAPAQLPGLLSGAPGRGARRHLPERGGRHPRPG